MMYTLPIYLGTYRRKVPTIYDIIYRSDDYVTCRHFKMDTSMYKRFYSFLLFFSTIIVVDTCDSYNILV